MRASTLRLLLWTAVVGSGLVARAAAADQIFVSITGQKSGVFPGEQVKGAPSKILVTGFESGVVSPRDASSGQATGKRQHKPLTITKSIGAASPVIFNAMVTNETLTSVLVEFARAGRAGAAEVYYTVKLTNASISEIHQSTTATTGGKGEVNVQPAEAVSFTFQKIEVHSNDSNTSAVDDVLTGLF